MRRPEVLRGVIAALLFATPVSAQVTLIPHGTPAAVTEALKATFGPQGFQAGKTDDKGALFTLDKGNITQNSANGMQVVHVTVEIQARYKKKTEGLEVSLKEEVVGTTRDQEMRNPVVNRTETDNLQKLLDGIRADIEAKATHPDSTVKRDSSGH